MDIIDQIDKDYSRNNKLTTFGKATLEDRYLLPGEDPQDLFARVAGSYADDLDHAQRLYDYMSKLWFMPATPILSNAGLRRGLPISCYLNSVPDNMKGIAGVWNENVFLASKGGGIGTYWGAVRGIGEAVSNSGHTSGIIPFVKVQDSLTLAVSQGSLRRGSAAVYIDIHHPEIEEFIDLRKPSGDFNRKALSLHHGVMIDDKFMLAVDDGSKYDLVSPKTGEGVKTVDARELWAKLLETRLATGEPYIVFSDTVNRAAPEHHQELGLKVSTSNLCSEVTLPTGVDYLGRNRTAVCCLSSLNLSTYDEWQDKKDQVILDVMVFLDNVLEDFIRRAPPEMHNAVYSVKKERSVGLGVMGFHTYLQKHNIPFESALAKAFNLKVFKAIDEAAARADEILAQERGACDDAATARRPYLRFSNKTSIAPTASISIICGGTSACIEPIPANIYTHKTLSGSFTVRNWQLQQVMERYALEHKFGQGWIDDQWNSILQHEGSVQHLEWMTDWQRAVFKTSFEIDQRWIIELAADRQQFIDQSQSLNLFLPATVSKRDLHHLHFKAWKSGVKSLYYLRSKSVARTGFAGGVEQDNTLVAPVANIDYEECLTCQ